MFKTVSKFAPAAAVGVAGLLLAGTASAASFSYYTASLIPLNESGVTGDVFLTFQTADSGVKSLRVQASATGLEEGAHPAHIHGFDGMDGTVRANVAPIAGVFDPDVDGDGDGFIELAEGGPFYGGILQTFAGLTAAADGTVDYDSIFDVADGSQLDDMIYSLDNRETVFHGITVPFGIEVDGNGDPIAGSVDIDNPVATFNAVLPVATAKFVATSGPGAPQPAPVPLPAGIFLMGAALGSLGVARKFRKG